MLKKYVKLILIRIWRHKSLLVTFTAELFMQLFMQRIAHQGWVFAAAFAPKTPHLDSSPGTRHLGFLSEQRALLRIAKCLVLLSGGRVGCHNSSISLAAPWGTRTA